jgi:hypothetical protein
MWKLIIQLVSKGSVDVRPPGKVSWFQQLQMAIYRSIDVQL